MYVKTIHHAFCQIALLWFFVAISLPVLAQIKKTGTPFIVNYSAKHYRAASENWAVLQDEQGRMFFGNHFGLLQFDGAHWQLILQPENKSMVRSLARDRSGRIYLGAQGDFGYATLQPNGYYYYTSLRKFIPESFRNFDDVWHTIVRSNEVLFHSRQALFIFKEGKITVIPAHTAFEELFEINDQIILLEKERGLVKLVGHALVPLPNTQLLVDKKVRKIFAAGQNLLILTQQEGMFTYPLTGNPSRITPWHTQVDPLLKDAQISCAARYPGGYYLIGTRQRGLIVLDSVGRLVQHLTTQTGLQNEYVTNMAVDREGNLWLTLKDGIDHIEIGSPLSRIQDHRIAETKIYCSILYKDRLYVGTDNGLYWMDWKEYPQGKRDNAGFQKVEGISENVWSLSVHQGDLLAFESNGVYQIEPVRARLLSPTGGMWRGVDLPGYPGFLLAGGYAGLYLYKKEGASWKFAHKIKGFEENSRVLVADTQCELWVAHGYKGIYQIRLNPQLDSVAQLHFYDQKDGFPSSLFLNVFKVNGQVVVGTTAGVYRLDRQQHRMVSDELFQKYLGKTSHIRLLETDANHNIWFIAGDRTGVIHPFKDGSFHKEELAFRKLHNFYIPGFENIRLTGDGNVFFGTQYGLIHYNGSVTKNYQLAFGAVISQVRCLTPRDSVLFTGQHDPVVQQTQPKVIGQPPALPYSHHSLRFSFASLWYENPEATQYQYWLEGFDKGWSEWGDFTEKEYTNLPEGHYAFRVRARNMYGVVSKEAVYLLEILPPWYRTRWAWAFYGLLFALFIYAIIRYQRHQARQERLQLIARQEKELLQKQAEWNAQRLKAEQEQAEMMRENLESTIQLKNAKVASSTVNLMHLNEILLSIKEQTALMESNPDPRASRQIIGKINRIIDHEIQGDHHWTDFEEVFNQIHDNFIQRLKASFPELTPRDIRLCAYLRMNLTTKEIAPLLGISVRGVEDTRYRIRKKLHLSPEANLTEFILNF